MRLVALVIVGFLAASGAANAGERSRFALLVGSNHGDPRETPLQYAERDAQRLAQTLRQLGEFPADQVLLLNGVDANEVRDVLIRLNARLREQREAVLFVFYSGHGDADDLHLAGTHLPTQELKALLVGSPATSRVLVVDACRSGSMTRIKGARPVPPFEIHAEEQPLPEGFAVLTSSAAAEDSQESSSLKGSFFTHYLNAALMGAADQNHDGTVTLAEAYGYASFETRAATVGTAAGPQNPTYQFVLGGRHDLVLTRPGRRDVRVGTLLFAQPGRYLVQRWDDATLSPPVADVIARERGVRLAVEPGSYKVTLRRDPEISEQTVAVVGDRTTELDVGDMTAVDRARVVRKGGVAASVTGIAVEAGARSSYLDLGAGAFGTVALRHDRRWYSLELRFSGDRSNVDVGDELVITSSGLLASVAVLKAVDVGPVTVAGGVELGAYWLHQTYSLGRSGATGPALPLTEGATPPTNSFAPVFGPLAQAHVPFGSRSYVRLELALPLMRTMDGTRRWEVAVPFRAAAGFGYQF